MGVVVNKCSQKSFSNWQILFDVIVTGMENFTLKPDTNGMVYQSKYLSFCRSVFACRLPIYAMSTFQNFKVIFVHLHLNEWTYREGILSMKTPLSLSLSSRVKSYTVTAVKYQDQFLKPHFSHLYLGFAINFSTKDLWYKLDI